jgi:hypothetical protein
MQLADNRLLKYEMISAPIPIGPFPTKIYFPDQPQLRNAMIQCVELPAIAFDLNNIPTLNNDSTFFTKTFITFNIKGFESIHNMPLTELKTCSAPAATNADALRNVNGNLGFNSQIVTWTKSYLTTYSTTVISTACSLVIGVYYY